MSLCSLAGIFHYSIPVLAQPVKNKLSLKSIFAVGFAFTTFVYVALGVILALYFGDAIKVICDFFRTRCDCVLIPATLLA